jgi:hypothetical protein
LIRETTVTLSGSTLRRAEPKDVCNSNYVFTGSALVLRFAQDDGFLFAMTALLNTKFKFLQEKNKT